MKPRRRDPYAPSIDFTAVYMKVPEGHVAFVEDLPGANTQAGTLDEAPENLREAVQLVLEPNRQLAQRSIAGHTVSKEPLALPTP